MADEITQAEGGEQSQPVPEPEQQAALVPVEAVQSQQAPPSAPAERRPYGQKRFQRRKVCAFCVDKIDYVDYKDIKRVRKYVTERGKILPRRISGNCATHQRMLTVAVKRARNIALVPFKPE